MLSLKRYESLRSLGQEVYVAYDRQRLNSSDEGPGKINEGRTHSNRSPPARSLSPRPLLPLVPRARR
jgi:hypothetical protein